MTLRAGIVADCVLSLSAHAASACGDMARERPQKCVPS